MRDWIITILILIIYIYASLYYLALFYLCRKDADQAEALLIRSLHKHKGCYDDGDDHDDDDDDGAA